VTGTVIPIRAEVAWPPAGLPDLEALGITYRQLDFWSRAGHLVPDNPDPGSGTPRTWPPQELEIARRMGKLTGAGIPPSLAAKFAREDWPRGEIGDGIWLEVKPS